MVNPLGKSRAKIGPLSMSDTVTKTRMWGRMGREDRGMQET